MFFHNYLYRLKCNIRDKQTLFWTMIFPILLATLFYMAFSNLSSLETFSEIKIGIVDNGEYQSKRDFIKAIEAVSNSNVSLDNNLFDISYISLEEADKLLDEKKIEGYIYFEDEIKLVVKETGINQTIIKSFIDEFKQTSSTIISIISRNPTTSVNNLLGSLANRENYLKTVALGKTEPNNIVVYFYSLLAMACLYGSFWGLKEVATLQANQSWQGARISMAPVHKMKLFVASMLAAASIQLGIILVFLGYLAFILKVSFGNQIGLILLTCVVGIITGVSFGTFIASIIKKGEGIKIGILIVFTNLTGFLSGMMYDKIKYIISTNFPILAYLNPLNLIGDSFYSLYYYDTYTKFFINIGLLCGFTGIFSIITYMVLRRQKYGSL